MRNFQVLFDNGEQSAIQHSAYAPYGQLGFPSAPTDSPWIYSNFVQSLDGIVSLKGEHSSGADISESAEDRWLMDLLRAHADAIVLGVNTLIEETRLRGKRGPIFRIMGPQLRDLRQKLRHRREKNIFVTGAATLNMSDYRVFDGEHVDAAIVTTQSGAARLQQQRTHPHVSVIVAGEGNLVDLRLMAHLLREQHSVERLLCEGGPTLYGYMSRAGLIDEKFVTISPVEVGELVPPEQLPVAVSGAALMADATRYRPTTFFAPGFTKSTAPWWTWMSSRRVGDHEFNRYRRKRQP